MICFLILEGKSKSSALHICKAGILRRLSRIRCSIRPARSWDAEKDLSENSQRSLIFMCFAYTPAKTAMKHRFSLNSGEFYVLPTSILNEHCKNQKSITLNSLFSTFSSKGYIRNPKRCYRKSGFRCYPPPSNICSDFYISFWVTI